MVKVKTYKEITNRMFKLKYERKLVGDDFIVMSYLFGILDTVHPKEVRNYSIIDFTMLCKSSVSKSLKRLRENGIIERVESPTDTGYILKEI